jgi:formylglycine-generating enzyme required for sulfatase activity
MMKKISLLAALGVVLICAHGAGAAEPWRETNTGQEFVKVAGGCYQMGQNETEKEELALLVGEEGANLAFGDELPVREVCVADFNLGRHEVTVDAFRKFVEATGYRTEAESGGGCQEYQIPRYHWEENPLRNWREPGFAQKGDEPVVCVSWNDARAFADWLSKANPGKSFRLASEAEWEYAARDRGKIKKFDATLKLDDSGWFVKNSPRRTSPVGQKKGGELGVFDLYGNVWEWVGDYYDLRSYATATKDNPVGPAQGVFRVLRGGGWNSTAWNCRAAKRDRAGASHRDTNLGFRLVYTGK